MKAETRITDLTEDMQQHAVDCASKALEQCHSEKAIADFIKEEFDSRFSPTWHCIVGCRRCVSSFSLETKHCIYIYLGDVAILPFRWG